MDKKYRTIKGMSHGGLAARAEGSEKAGTARKVGNARKMGNVEKTGIAEKIENAIRFWLSSRRNRILVAILAGMLAAFGVSGDLSALSRQEPSPSLTAWWGSLYPKFCYAETPEHETSSSHPVKISFRLAELFK